MVKKYLTRFIIPLGIFFFWSAIILWRTGGLSAFTTYSYTLFNAGSIPRPVPDLEIISMNGKKESLDEYRGKYILIEFMYLHCSTVCGILRAKLYEYYPSLTKENNNIILMSLSFDPQRDTPDILYSSWQSLGEKKQWIFGSIAGGD